MRDPKDGVRALRRWGRKAEKDPHKAMGALATFAEVLKRAVALLRCVPQKFGNIIEAFKDAAAAVARALEASSFSITFDLPRTISLGLLLDDLIDRPGPVTGPGAVDPVVQADGRSTMPSIAPVPPRRSAPARGEAPSR